MKLEHDDDQLMVIAAHRYCLGRQSYIVGACLDWLRQTWPQMVKNTQHVILRDTIEALIDCRAGREFVDVPGWREAVVWMAQSMPPEQLATIRAALAWKGIAVDSYLPSNVALSGGCI